MGSNYDKQKKDAAQRIAAQDLRAAADRLGLVCDDTHVYLDVLDLSCSVRRSDGFAACRKASDPEYREADFNTAMILYDLLGYAAKDACPSGEYARLESFSAVHNARSYAGEGAFTSAAQLFEREFDKLKPACAELGAVPYGKGDVSCRLPLFGELCMAISFWRADDEFPASLSISFDRSTPQYLHYETMWYAASLCIQRIRSHFPGEGAEPTHPQRG